MDSGSLQEDVESLTHLADGDKGVAWADQTRVSTNDLQDVNVSSFSLTQQQLFDCFLEHSSPRVRGHGLRRDSPQLFPSSLSILTSTTTASSAHREDPDGSLAHPLRCSSQQESQISSAPTTPTPPPTPRISAAGTGTVTVRASHTISSHTSPHGNADSSSSGGGSVIVTTDVRISSDMTGSDPDDLSDVSASSGVGTYSMTSEPVTSDPTHSDTLDYDLLEKKTTPTTSTKLTAVVERTRTPAFSLSKIPQPITPVRTLHGSRGSTTPYPSSRTSQDRPPIGAAPQPYSMFQPFTQRPPIRSLSSSQVAMPPTMGATPLSSSHALSTESGIGRGGGHVTQSKGQVTTQPSSVTSQAGHVTRSRGQPLIPNRPMANGFMVRSSPSSSFYGNGGPMYGLNRFGGFEDNFVSPPQQGQQRRFSDSNAPQQGQQRRFSDSNASPGIINKPVAGTMKAPIGARLKSPFSSLPSPFHHQTATPNPYVKAPAHMPRPPHVYQSITIPGPTHLPHPPLTTTVSANPSMGGCTTTTASADQRSNLSKSTALSGSKCSLVGDHPGSKCSTTEDSQDGCGLNSTFTVEVGVTNSDKPQERGGGGAKKDRASGTSSKKGSQGGGGRGLFSRSRSPGKLPSYLKMTKSAESKKVSR